jgi:hypothetical protein
MALIFTATVPAVSHTAFAGEVSPRSIEMSDATASATGVTYHVNFTAATTGILEGIVIDFCDNDPLIGDSCTAPSGFSVGATPTFANLTGTNPTTGWTATSLNTGRTFVLTNGSGGSVSASTAISFDITNVSNPDTPDHPFYARILTYANSTDATNYAAGSEGSYTDSGGAALSTTLGVSVTARVMETLSFCVYHATCGDDPSISIGHGPDTILDASAVNTADDDFSISTNAGSGVAVLMKGGTLTSGSNTIPAAGSPSGSATPAAITAGTAAFGMYLSTVGTGMSAATTYAGAGGAYGLDTANLSSTYGDTIATSLSVLNASVCTMQFGATADNTTPAGIYTVSEELIATGTF